MANSPPLTSAILMKVWSDGPSVSTHCSPPPEDGLGQLYTEVHSIRSSYKENIVRYLSSLTIQPLYCNTRCHLQKAACSSGAQLTIRRVAMNFCKVKGMKLNMCSQMSSPKSSVITVETSTQPVTNQILQETVAPFHHWNQQQACPEGYLVMPAQPLHSSD